MTAHCPTCHGVLSPPTAPGTACARRGPVATIHNPVPRLAWQAMQAQLRRVDPGRRFVSPADAVSAHPEALSLWLACLDDARDEYHVRSA